MDFWRAVEILGSRWRLLAVCTLLTAGVTFAAARLVGTRWQATVRFAYSPNPVNVDGQASPNAMDVMGGDVQGARAQAPGYEAVFKTRDVLEPALEKVGVASFDPDLLDTIKVEAIGPRLFELRVVDSSAEKATVLANALAESFVTKNRTLYTQPAEKVVLVLQSQLKRVEKRLAQVRSAHDRYRRSHQIVTNLDDKVAPAIYRQQMAQQRHETVRAQLAEAIARLRSIEGEAARTPPTVNVERRPEASPVARQLEEELARADQQLTTLRARYTEEHIQVRQALAVYQALRQRLDAERGKQPETIAVKRNPVLATLWQRIRDARQEIRGLRAQRDSLAAAVNNARGEISRLNGVDSTIVALTSELGELTEERTSLKNRLQAASTALDAAERQNPVAVVDRSSEFNPPVNLTTGRTLKLTLLAALCALAGLSGLILALETMDRRVRTVQQAELALPSPVIAAVPQPSGGVTLQSLPRATELHPLSPHAEAYRFLALRMFQANGHAHSVMLMSAKGGQGTTTTAANLAITLAQAGRSVILVDANMRAPRLHDIFGIDNEFGLSSLISKPDAASLERALQTTTVSNLRVVCSGPTPENPWELFRSPNFSEVAQRMRDLSDYVLFDTPSAVAFSDALNVAPVVDAAVICLRALEAPSGSEARLIEFLEQCGVTVLGTVVENVPAGALESRCVTRHYPAGRPELPARIEDANPSAVAAGA
ncbi:MAG: GumC family protein [Armatimonadota bacterium]